jgi:hypothetical protein
MLKIEILDIEYDYNNGKIDPLDVFTICFEEKYEQQSVFLYRQDLPEGIKVGDELELIIKRTDKADPQSKNDSIESKSN